MQANVLKFRWVQPFRGVMVSDRQISAPPSVDRTSPVTGLIRGSHSGSNFDPRRIVPTVKDEARSPCLHGSGMDPDLIFAAPILSPYDEREALADDIHLTGRPLGDAGCAICPAIYLRGDCR